MRLRKSGKLSVIPNETLYSKCTKSIKSKVDGASVSIWIQILVNFGTMQFNSITPGKASGEKASSIHLASQSRSPFVPPHPQQDSQVSAANDYGSDGNNDIHETLDYHDSYEDHFEVMEDEVSSHALINTLRQGIHKILSQFLLNFLEIDNSLPITQEQSHDTRTIVNSEILLNQADNHIDNIRNSFIILVEKYFYLSSEKPLLKMFSKIETLPENGSVSLSELVTSMSSAHRPSDARKIEMIKELREAGLINFKNPKKNSYIITKGPMFSDAN